MRADTVAFEDPATRLPGQPTNGNMDSDAAMPNAVASTGGVQQRVTDEDRDSAIGTGPHFDAPKARGRRIAMPVTQAARSFAVEAYQTNTTEQRVNVRWGFRVSDVGYGSDRAASVRVGPPSKDTTSLYLLHMTSL